MMQQQKLQHNPAGGMSFFAFLRRGRSLVFVFFVLLSSVLAFPALFMSLLLWCGFDMERDYDEYRRIVWMAAIIGMLLYIGWVQLVAPFPQMFIALWGKFVDHLWQDAAIELVLLWLVNMMLTPLFVLLLSFFDTPPQVLLSLSKQATDEEKGERDQEEDTVQDEFEGWEKMFGEKETSSSSLLPGVSAAALPETDKLIQPLGTYLAGELTEYVLNGEFLVGPDLFALHGVVVGEPMFGKTTTLLALAAIAMQYGKKVIYLDLKGSRKTAAQFLALMRQNSTGRVGLFPIEAYNGWKGDSQAIVERLLQQVDLVSHLFDHAGDGSTAVSLAVKAPGGLPHNSAEFLERLDVEWLELAYAHDVQALSEIRDIAAHIRGVRLIFADFFCGLAGSLDGTWAIDDVDHAYIGMDGVSQREEAAAFGRYILDDATSYAMSRKDPHEQILLIIDEFGLLESTNVTRWFESIRKAGTSVYAAGQSYRSLGQERDTLLAASAVKILHRCGSPEPFIRFVGRCEQDNISRVRGVQTDDENMASSLANRLAGTTDIQQHRLKKPQEEFVVSPEDVQRLERGQVIMIVDDRATSLYVKSPVLVQNVLLAAVRYINQGPVFKSLSLPVAQLKAAKHKDQGKKSAGQKLQGNQQKKEEVAPQSVRPQERPPPRLHSRPSSCIQGQKSRAIVSCRKEVGPRENLSMKNTEEVSLYDEAHLCLLWVQFRSKVCVYASRATTWSRVGGSKH
jgi:hypothetical protein